MQSIEPNIQTSDYRVEVPQKDRTGARFVFTVADLIAPTVKASNPEWRHGGLIRNNATLAYKNGYVPRCEITQLRQQMASEQAAYCHPNERKHLIPMYNIVENGTQRQVGFKKVGDEVFPDGLLRTPIYPSDEIRVLANQLDGLVEMPVNSTLEKEAAQAFLFPNWNEIKAGLAKFPATIQQIKAYFEKRLKIALDAGTGKEMFVLVARAAIKSCDDYMAWGNVRINEQNSIYDTAKAKGWAWSYGSEAEMLFEQLGIQRRDNLVQGNADKLDKLTEAMTANANLQAQFMQFQMEQAQKAALLVQNPMQPAPSPAASTAPVQHEQADENAGAESFDGSGPDNGPADVDQDKTDAPADEENTDGLNDAENETPEKVKLGDIVLAAGSEGEVIHAAKKVKVRFKDGREDAFDRTDVIFVRRDQ